MKQTKRKQKSAQESACHCHDHDHEEHCGCHEHDHEKHCGCHEHDHEKHCGCHEHDHEKHCGCHEHDHEEHCGCHDHDHEEHCGCHDHDHGEHCGCHDHDHGEAECGCGCGCGHDHEQTKGGALGLILRYVLGAIPVILAFLPFPWWQIRLGCAIIGYVLFGLEVWRDMLRGFARGRIFTEFTLMCVASVGAFAIGEYADGAAVMYLYSLGETLSGRAYRGARRNLSELLEITPDRAVVLRGGEALRVSPDEVEIGERILVVAGERIPLDGRVVAGGGSADTSSVTGESTPLSLYEGVFCPSGAILSEGSVELSVSARYENSVVARMTAAVKEATARKSAAEKKISRFARIFTPIAFVVAAAIVLIGWLVTGELLPWLRTGLVVLVVSCPCSLVLSVPLTYFAGLGFAASRGIVFRGGEVMDRLARTRAVVFDKTGTLTESKLRFEGAVCEDGVDETEFLELAYEVLLHSAHAAAIAFCETRQGVSRDRVTRVQSIGGRGIVCLVDGSEAWFGNAALMRERGLDLEDSPTTVIFGALDGRLLGQLCFSAPLKQGTAEAIRTLGKQGVGRTVVLSGDGAVSVADACREAGIKEYAAALTPAEKVERFEAIRAEEHAAAPDAAVVYCGDGLNDSAVIAGADVGLAMGGCGSALTVSTADVVLMDDDPRKVCEAIAISRRTSRIAGQNIALSLGMKVAVLLTGLVLSALTGAGLSMELAIIADVGAAILAVLNAMRAAKKRKGAGI